MNNEVHFSQVIQERRRKKSEGCYAPLKKDLLDLLMQMYDEETDSILSDEELRSQVIINAKVIYICNTVKSWLQGMGLICKCFLDSKQEILMTRNHYFSQFRVDSFG